MAQDPAFTYQGRLTDTNLAANGVYDFEFRLYDQSSAQIGTTLTREDVAVTHGVFTVTLDFGVAAFIGQPRSMEIAVRPGASSGSFSTLSPRQPITSSPYAVRTFSAAQADNATTSADALKLGGVAASDYVKTDDPRLVPGPPIAGSPNYIQNGTNPQVAASFNISGDGTAGGTLTGSIIAAKTQYNINGNRVIGISGPGNTFVGFSAGQSNVVQNGNSLADPPGGSNNSFFGVEAGMNNTAGLGNSFFGAGAASRNTNGGSNSSFGYEAGSNNTTASFNSYFGSRAGLRTETGSFNSFFGTYAGSANISGHDNTFVGVEANPGRPDLSNATAIGANARVDTSNSLVLGSAVNVGIGTSSPTDPLTVKSQTSTYGIVHTDGEITLGTFVGGAENGAYLGTRSNHPLHFFVNNGPASVTLDTSGVLRLNNLGSAGIAHLCLNSSRQISPCSSSLRYKTNIAPLTSGLSLIQLLRPITFDWKASGEHDLGLGAEDVARVDPLLVVHNAKGEVEGVKYDRIAVVLVNAVREQQQQIEQLQREILALKRHDLRRQRRHSATGRNLKTGPTKTN